MLFYPSPIGPNVWSGNNITINLSNYVNGQIPKYGNCEITFQIENTVAGNFQLPYDPSLPNDIDWAYLRH